MIAGMITLEYITIVFSQNKLIENTIDYKVMDTLENIEEVFTAIPSEYFFKALAIAVHNNGTPDYNIDYDDAERIMGIIHWIS